MASSRSLTLENCLPGKWYTVRGFVRPGSLDEAAWYIAKRRLEALGITRGSRVKMISRLTGKGPAVVWCMGSRVGLSQILCSAVWVEPVHFE